MLHYSKRSQIALEFMIIYAIVLIVFVVVFALIANERSVALAAQQASVMQLISQSVASYINQAMQAGSGYSAFVPLSAGIGLVSYSISISTTGLVIANTTVGKEIITGIAQSNARNLYINGTLVSSGNGINVYRIPTYTGYVKVANAGGSIFVDVPSPQPDSLAGPPTLSQPGSVVAPYFNGVNSLISAPANSVLTIGNSISLDAWVEIKSLKTSSAAPYLDNPIIGEISSTAQPFMLSITNGGAPIFLMNWGGASKLIGQNSIVPGALYNIAATYNKSSGIAELYVDGLSVATSKPGVSITGSANVIIGGSPANATYLNGYVINAQIYNTSLPADQIGQIYSSGPAAAPATSLGNLVGWWPLNGNPNDYSGYGNNGAASDVSYQYSVDTLAGISTLGGVAAPGVPVGFFTSKNLLGGSNSVATNTTSAGQQSALLTANGFSGNATIYAESFNGNLTTVGNLVGWWPLSVNDSLSVPDFSGKGNIGSLVVGSSQSKAVYLPVTSNTAFNAANFNGANSYVQINNTQQLQLSNVTISGWVDYAGPASSTYGWLVAKEDAWGVGACGPTLLVCYYDWGGTGEHESSVSLSTNKWYFLTATVANGIAENVYLNGVNVLSNSVSISNQNFGVQIGYGNAAGELLDGAAANIQIYNRVLSPGQISKLYLDGLPGAPLPNSGLVGWWPLNGNANDYASQAYISSNAIDITFNSISYNNTAKIGQQLAAFSLQGTGVEIPSAPNSILGSGPKTAAAWVYPISFNSTSPCYVVSIGSQSTDGYGFNLIINNNGYLGASTATDVQTPVYSQLHVPLDRWSFVTLSYSNSRYGVSLDGVPDTLSLSTAQNLQQSSWYIGSCVAGIADAQIYNTSLSQYQIQQLYLQGMPQAAGMDTTLG